MTVSVKNAPNANTTSDANGKVTVSGLSDGTAIIHFSFIGYTPRDLSITLPDTLTHIIFLVADEKVLEQITVVSSTRNNDPVETAKIKVEVLGLEDMNEESTLKPGNIASIIGMHFNSSNFRRNRNCYTESRFNAFLKRLKTLNVNLCFFDQFV